MSYLAAVASKTGAASAPSTPCVCGVVHATSPCILPPQVACGHGILLFCLVVSVPPVHRVQKMSPRSQTGSRSLSSAWWYVLRVGRDGPAHPHVASTGSLTLNTFVATLLSFEPRAKL